MRGIDRIDSMLRSERVAVNLVSETESDLAVMEHMAPVDEGGEILQASAPGRLPLVRPLLALMALLLVGEWLLYQRKYRDE